MKLRIYNKTLDPKIWDKNKTLNPDVKESLLKIAEDFYNSTDLKSDIHNILFLGSSANYNWTNSSDVDLHVVIDIAEEKINEEYARKFMDVLTSKWNTDHEITVKEHPVEVYLQDVREPNATAELSRPGASIYSIFDDKWVVEPNPQNIKIDADKVRKKYHELKDRIISLIQSEDIKKLKALMTTIRNYRNAGMSDGGEFSVENIVFKALRHSGALEKLKTAINTIYDKKASLPEEGNIPTYKKTRPLNEVISNKPFLVVGSINSDLEINSKIDYIGATDYYYNTEIVHSNELGISWRYKSKTNTVYFHEISSIEEKEKDAILDHLHTKYNVVNPIFDFSGWEGNYTRQAHFVNELINNRPFLIVGMVNDDDIEVKSKIDFKGAIDTYGTAPVTHGNRYGTAWRYKSKTNTVYMRSSGSIDEKVKDAILDHLHTKYNITDPSFDFSSWLGNYGSAHFINELFNKNANLFLGFINKENFKIVGWHVKNEFDSHEDFYKRVPDSWSLVNAKRWRYRKDLNKIYWWSDATETEKTELSYWLEKVLGVKSPQSQIINVDAPLSDKNRVDSHTMDKNQELNELSTMENEINRSDWKKILEDMTSWLTLEAKLGNIGNWYNSPSKTNDPEILVKTLRGIESYYEGGISGFIQDYDNGELKENVEKKIEKG